MDVIALPTNTCDISQPKISDKLLMDVLVFANVIIEIRSLLMLLYITLQGCIPLKMGKNIVQIIKENKNWRDQYPVKWVLFNRPTCRAGILKRM